MHTCICILFQHLFPSTCSLVKNIRVPWTSPASSFQKYQSSFICPFVSLKIFQLTFYSYFFPFLFLSFLLMMKLTGFQSALVLLLRFLPQNWFSKLLSVSPESASCSALKSSSCWEYCFSFSSVDCLATSNFFRWLEVSLT